LWRLEQERLTRRSSEHDAIVGELRAQLGELRNECQALSARESVMRESAVKDTSETAKLRDQVHRLGAAAMVRIIAASHKQHLAWGHMQWRIYTVTMRSSAQRSSSLPDESLGRVPAAPTRSAGTPQSMSDQQPADVVSRAAERVALAHDSENRSPHNSRISSVHQPLQKAIHLRQRLQEHAPRGSTGAPHVGDDESRAGPKASAKKGALLRGLRLRLEQ